MYKNKNYAEFLFKFQKIMGRHVIMDNGAVETGRALSMKSLLDIHEKYPVSEIVMPDSINDMEETLSYMRAASYDLKQWIEMKKSCKYSSNDHGSPPGQEFE